ncbi:tetraprenyl-beta-curcumene synthase [Anaerobacterium chartisolvens]|uniref:Tetraprenyl-beta-curcumene synthase n=1 Tax=Anaerobacterium chartisolvens TaxID=1297424 RepID=A0A369B9T9_9FIRM|nr:tetraprenyl-beta-curcumene synthase family protein [Anaerobacterium chartisolvens]RCX18290.1 tetraprenyl-beta-curcumene synthase [Anaerobacterium chartisolvens]
MKLISKYVRDIFPQVDEELCRWKKACADAGDQMLLNQAAASIRDKKFHCQGGSIYALYPGIDTKKAIKFIVSIQTISDYLDNLCDRAGVYDEEAFLTLHLSLSDAVTPDSPACDYYKHYPYKNDGGYLTKLVMQAKSQLSGLPSYHLVKDKIRDYARRYSEMQSFKHLSSSVREKRLREWAEANLSEYRGISYWEYSAAAGSTLGIFILYALAFDPSLSPLEVSSVDSAYFPWVSGLHILLDYYIDLKEDIQEGELNFTSYYRDLTHCRDRMQYFIRKSTEHCSRLCYSEFHMTVIKGLLSMYLSDPKASEKMQRRPARGLITQSGVKAGFYYNICRLLRAASIL